METAAGQTVNILLVEEDEADATAFRRALAEKDIHNPLFHAADGADALDMLRGAKGAMRVPRPCLVVLDLDTPRMSGVELLAAIAGDPVLEDTVVLVLTTPQDAAGQEARVEAYRRHVAGFVTKDNAGESFLQAIGALDHLWRLVETPGRTA